MSRAFFYATIGSTGDGHLQRVRQATLSQFDLESVLALRFGVPQGRLSRSSEICSICGLTDEHGFRLLGSPRLGANATEGDPRACYVLAGNADHHRGGRQGKLVRRPIAQLQV